MPVPKGSQYDLAIIIVNYNVKTFLHFCLKSIYAAQGELKLQLIVVDNNSADGSAIFLEENHDNVEIISCEQNNGYAKACNLGFAKSNAQFVLFLNPDTIISENSLAESINYYNTHDDIGAIGLKMIDGSGNFLPESKRGAITANSALYKIMGLAKLFPKSAVFNQYYLGHLDNSQSHEIDVLTGAYFFTSSAVLEIIGVFDERFFMYGEDIDLSYRIKQSGKKIIYLPNSTIIHFKGESTQKSSIGYFNSFYGSMKLFVDKHYSSGVRLGSNLLLSIGIFIMSIAGIITRIVKKGIHPLIDAGLIAGTLFMTSQYWSIYYHENVEYFDSKVLWFNIGLYTLIWSGLLIVNRTYTKNQTIATSIKSIFQGLVLILVIYALLGNTLRSSRAVILVGFVSVLIVLALSKYLISLVTKSNQRDTILVSGQISENLKVALRSLRLQINNNPSGKRKKQLFSIGDMPYSNIINNLSSQNIEGLFYDPIKNLLIGSYSKRERGINFDESQLYQITSPVAKSGKRTFDIITAIAFIILIPINVLWIKDLQKYLKNLSDIANGRSAFFSYTHLPIAKQLPTISPGNFYFSKDSSIKEQNLKVREYALHYSVMRDITLLLTHYPNIVAKIS